ncbi:sensor histidine kinase [Streptomyces sp. NPDC005805]|uniref:sensor histidine kinase n=1 Tax=Streptomyces sp. NPDC005805 TaxID=3157068 RepID=UPI0033C23377
MSTARGHGAGAAREAPAVVRHELYPYAGDDAFLSATLRFIGDAVDGDEAVVVAVPPGKAALLRPEVPPGRPVRFVDPATYGGNPGRLIAAWQSWVDEYVRAGRPVRTISETDWAHARTPADVAELRYHEWLLNKVLAQTPAWSMLCPFDTTGTGPDALRALGRCHPLVLREGRSEASADWSDEAGYTFEDLSRPCEPHEELPYARGDLAAVRDRITHCATAQGMKGRRLRELHVAATEVATNTIRHGGGHGTLRIWTEGDALVCEFEDAGYIKDPLAGRIRPANGQLGGRGLWLVHQFCDLVEIRSTPEAGTRIRLHMGLHAEEG